MLLTGIAIGALTSRPILPDPAVSVLAMLGAIVYDIGTGSRVGTERALYMQGWSLFKQARLEDALKPDLRV